MIYTSHGLMTAGDLEEYRRDTDWYELHPRIPEDDECEHCRQWTDDCDDCDLDDVRAKVGRLTKVLSDVETLVYQAINGAPASELPRGIAELLSAYRRAEAETAVAR